MTLIEQIKADAEQGTPGPWEIRYKNGETHLYMINHPDAHSQMCDMTYYPWVPENTTDWERIARVPTMEAALLAADALAEALAEMAEDAEHDIDNAGQGWVGMPYSVFSEVLDALSAYRNAVKGE